MHDPMVSILLLLIKWLLGIVLLYGMRVSVWTFQEKKEGEKRGESEGGGKKESRGGEGKGEAAAKTEPYVAHKAIQIYRYI